MSGDDSTQHPKSPVELDPEESVVLMVRQHWFVFRDPFLLAFFVPFVLLSVLFFVDYTTFAEMVKRLISQIALYGALVSFALGTLLFMWRYYLWINTYYIITNKRLILINQYSLFSHQDRETSHTMIQDVRANVDGLQPTLYGFGDVTVQVSSEDARLVLEKVARPREVQHVIVKEAHLKKAEGI